MARVTIVKQCADAKFQHDWLMDLPAEHRPPGLTIGEYLNKPAIYTNLMSGRRPDYVEVLDFLEEVVWGTLVVKKCDVSTYLRHLWDILDKVDLARPNYGPNVFKISEVLNMHSLTACDRVHGDATLLNFLTHEGRVVSIDPGHHHGLVCKELDESKIMQSLDGWDQVKTKQDVRIPSNWTSVIRPRRVHWALLASHYLRILNHRELHDEDCLEFAKSRFLQITREVL